jgi:hypothetical protein
MTIPNDSYMQYRETESERKLREFASLPDPKRPKSEHFMEYFYEYLVMEKTPDMNMLPHSDLFYIRAALEQQFPERTFTMEEVRTLVDQEFGIQYPKPATKIL